MRKNFATLTSVFAFFLFAFQGLAQDKTMTWTTTSDKARELALKGAKHLMNIETAQAYDQFKQALELDPDFTIALTFMATMTIGATQKDYEARALKSAANKTDGEKLFVNILSRDTTGKTFRETFSKLHDMFPDGSVVNLYYVFSRPSDNEQFAAAMDYMKKFPDQACIYNLIGYMYKQIKKDTATAKTYFEKYIEMYPDGCNPYDSMGEWYFDTGDMANAEKYYKLALEKYPFNNSSIEKLNEIREKKKTKQ